MSKTRTLLLPLWFYALSLHAVGIEQTWITESWLNTELGNAPIHTVIFDDYGRLLLGSERGVYRATGKTITRFAAESGADHALPSSDITDLTVHPSGRVFATCYGSGLIEISLNSGNTRSFTEFGTRSARNLESIDISPDGRLWVTDSKDLFILNPISFNEEKTELSRRIVEKTGNPKTISFPNSRTAIVAGLENAVLVDYERLSTTPLDLSWLAKGEYLSAIKAFSEELVVFGTTKGRVSLLSTITGEFGIARAIDNTLQPRVAAFAALSDRLLIATNDGLFMSDLDLKRIFDISDSGEGLPNRDIDAITTHGDAVWIGTYFGLHTLSIAKFELYNRNNSEVDNDILSIEVDHENTVWVGTFNGLYHRFIKDSTHTRYKAGESERNALHSQHVSALESDSEQLWIGFTSGPIQTLNFSTGALQTVGPDDRGALFAIQILHAKGSIWVATHGHGLLRYRDGLWTSYAERGDLPSRSINALHQTDSGRLLAIAHDRVYAYDSSVDTFSPLPIRSHEGYESITVLSMTNAEGIVWIGTANHGLLKWNTTGKEPEIRIESTILSNSLPSTKIYSLETGSHGYLWASTDNGILLLSPAGELVRASNTLDGIQGDDFTSGVSATSPSGDIFFGGPSGYNRVPPEVTSLNSDSSRILVLELETEEERVSLNPDFHQDPLIYLSRSEMPFTVRFTTVDQVDPSKFVYKYSRTGETSNWIYLGNRNELTIDGLEPGEYEISLSGSNSFGVWDNDQLSLSLHVEPPLWLRWPAFVIYGIAIWFGYWILFRIHRSYKLAQEKEDLLQELIETENRAEDEIQEQMDLHDSLATSAYRHNQNMLDSLKIALPSSGRSDSEREGIVKRAEPHLKALALLEDSTLYEGGGAAVDFYHFCDKAMKSLIEASGVDRDTMFEMNEIERNPFTIEVATPMAIIVYELLRNSLIHAYPPDSPVNYLSVTSSVEHDEELNRDVFCLEVRDSGRGLDEAILEEPEEGSGLAVAREIGKTVGAEFVLLESRGTTIKVRFLGITVDDVFA